MFIIIIIMIYKIKNSIYINKYFIIKYINLFIFNINK